MRNNITTSIIYTQALLESLRSSPLLVDDLPEAVCFDRGMYFREDRAKVEAEDDLPELNYSQKLGHLYEDALGYLLKQSSSLELIGQSIQIFDSNRITIGELDYLLKDLTNERFIHLELAVKFYLVHYDGGKPFYPGPDPRDNWLNKLKRMREHQLLLAKSEDAQNLLLDKYGIEELSTQHLIYGKLFDHYLSEEKPKPPAIQVNSQRGTWKYLSEWQKDSEAELVKIIPKCLWPTRVENLLSSIDLMKREDFITETMQRCTMIWDEKLRDTQFIVPDTWRGDEVR